ncbi:MAG TPA: ABC transporter permease [Candidatus Baltobacteraceae bacterium]|jgi:putative ABC transport system permease protein
MIFVWLRGLFRTRSGRLAGAIVGVALTIALLAAIGSFVSSSSARMTSQAIAGVAVDWQVQLNPGADPKAIVRAIGKATAYTSLKRVWYASVSGFELSQKGSTQTTGAGKAVGLQDGYFTTFPREVRRLIGSHSGALLFQQTAANLHANVGDMVTIRRVGLSPVRVRVAGIVAMPDIDSFFQAVGLPPGSAPQAPPDNVVLMPESQWHALFDKQRTVRPDSVREQFHVRISHRLPSDPSAAYAAVAGAAKNVEARIAGSGIIGDNLAAKLLGTQADALYARVLFLFLGIPGAVLAVLLTFAVAASGSVRRSHEQALLRVRGASTGQLLGLSGVEALVVALGGVVLGLILHAALDGGRFGGAPSWLIFASCIGFIVALLAVLVPAWQQARSTTVAQARATVGRAAAPLWERLYLDVILLIVAILVFWRTASTGYQVVLAPEGVPQTSVHYEAFLAPLLLWIGAGLLTVRIWRFIVTRGRGVVAAALRGLAAQLAGVVAASLDRQHGAVTRAILLVGLAFAFGVSTAVFNATYNAQSRVDAQLTTGADVTVSGLTGAPPSSKLAQLRAIPHVAAAVAMQHRYAYVGSDLQDLYGIDPRTIGSATPMSDAFFGNNDSQKALAALIGHRDGVLVSEETVQTYQLKLGDRLTLRLQDVRTHRYVPVSFVFVGVSREFPTAPKDSFLIANMSYVAAKTHSNAAEDVLIRVDGNAVAGVRTAAQKVVATLPGATVTDILQSQRKIGSSLTAIDLHGLTAIELIFAVVFVAASTGLLLALGFSERLRTFAILAAIGTKDRQLGAFLWSEAGLVVSAGGAFGIVLGFLIAQMLVKVLTGVFDPPPAALTVPWAYLGGLVIAALVSTAIAVSILLKVTKGAVLGALRGL